MPLSTLRSGSRNVQRSGLAYSFGIILFLAATLAAFGQQQTASITGRITDSTGAAVPSATVTVSAPSHGIKRVVTTDDRGSYVVALLPPASEYSVTAEKTGFERVSRSDLVLQVAQVAEIDLSLPIGSAAETVTVTSAPPLLDTQTSAVGQVISEKTITGLALNGRSTFRLIQLTPVITFNQGASQFGDVATNTTFDTNFAINGSRAQSNDILIDGVPSTAGTLTRSPPFLRLTTPRSSRSRATICPRSMAVTAAASSM